MDHTKFKKKLTLWIGLLIGSSFASVSANYWNSSRYQRIEKCIKFALFSHHILIE